MSEQEFDNVHNPSAVLNPSGSSLSIAYVTERFPIPTEYFILKEILALEKRDIKIFILAIEKANHTITIPELTYLKAPVFYSSDTSFPVQIINFIKCCRKLMNILDNKRYFNVVYVLKQFRYLFSAYNFEKQLKNIKITHVHAHFAFVATDVGHILSRLLNVNFSFTGHAQDIYLNQKHIVKKIENASFVMTCTRQNEGYIKQLTEHKFDNKIYRVYHGIDVNGFAPRERKDFGDKTVICILTVARLVEKKGIIYLLKAVKILVDNEIKVICTIIGHGHLRKELECFVDKAGMRCYVNFLGMKRRNEVLAEMSVADIFILPCIVASDGDMDGLPNVLLEAMAMGIPVISTAVSAIPELIETNHSGILIPEKDEKAIANAVLKLINDIKLYNSIIINARSKIQNDFNIDDSTEKIIRLFRKYAQN